MNTIPSRPHGVLASQRTEAVYLSIEGALVTSRWIAIGDHTLATGDVDKAFIRTNEQRTAALGCAGAALAVSFAYVPAAAALVTAAVAFAVRGVLRPKLELVLHGRSGNTVVLEVGSKSRDNPNAETLKRVHGAIALAIGMSPAADAASPVEGAR